MRRPHSEIARIARVAKGVLAVLVGVVFVASVAQPVSAQDRDLTKAGYSGMAFLKIGVGARAMALGGAYVSRATGPQALFWNPAGIAMDVDLAGLTMNNLQWIADIQQNAGGAVVSLGGWGVVGLSAAFMNYGTLHGTQLGASSSAPGEIEYVDTGTFGVSEYVVGLTYARAVTDRFSVGAKVKRAMSELGKSDVIVGGEEQTMQNDASAWALDVGTRYQTSFNDLAFAMSIQNISAEHTFPNMYESFYLPLVYTFGVSMDVWEFARLPGAEVNELMVQVNGLHPNDNVERINFGIEYSLADQFFLRGGYKLNDDIQNYSGGLGYRYEWNDYVAQLDYAATSIQYFDAVHRFSLAFSF